MVNENPELTLLTDQEIDAIEREYEDLMRYGDADEPGPSGQDLRVTSLTRDDVRWAPDERNPNSRHLPKSSTATFNFTAAHLAVLCAANRFALPVGQSRVIFGLRGCRVASGDHVVPFTTSVSLEEGTPDHTTPCCVVGVWDRDRAQIAVFTATTVPYWRYVANYMANGPGANMMPTGLYRYRVGRHRTTPGALRFAEPSVIVVRPDKKKKTIEFETNDLWDGPVQPFNNIHAAGAVRSPLGSTGSAGCQTLPGYWSSDRSQHYGNWQKFRELSGVDGALDGTPYTYVLLTGREARLTSVGAPREQLSRLRFGSRGDDVKALQRALGLSADGIWGPSTSRKLITWQWGNLGDWADAIVTPEWANRLGFRMN